MKNQYLLIPVPLEDIIESGIDFDSVIQTYAVDGKIIIENADGDEDGVCGEDCESCPFFNPECGDEGDCENCPCCCPECGECMCDAVMMEGEGGDE